MILLGLLLLPFAFAASLITCRSRAGSARIGQPDQRQTELDDEYRLVGGQIYLDLTRIEDDGEPIEINASVAIGELHVVPPRRRRARR